MLSCEAKWHSPSSALGDTRPFIVSARAVDARALGTQFVVRQHEDHTELTVIAHHVAVLTPPSPGRERLPFVLASGQTVRATAHAGLEPVRVVDLRAVTAWQRGRLNFDRVPLRTVLQELNRYHRGHLLLADRTLAQRPVSGVLLLTDLETALTTIATELRLKVQHFSPFLTVLY